MERARITSYIIAAVFALVAGRTTAQLSLPDNLVYTESFNTIGEELPTGWSVRENVTDSYIGDEVGYEISPTPWSSADGQFANYANPGALLSSASEEDQNNSTDRALGIRQSDSFGNFLVAFVLHLDNTQGKGNFQLSFDFLMLNVGTKSTNWTVEYAIGEYPEVWVSAGAQLIDPCTFGSKRANFDLGSALDNQSSNVWIRIVALEPASGTGTFDTFAIDNFMLTWDDLSCVSLANYFFMGPTSGPPGTRVRISTSNSLSIEQVLVGEDSILTSIDAYLNTRIPEVFPSGNTQLILVDSLGCKSEAGVFNVFPTATGNCYNYGEEILLSEVFAPDGGTQCWIELYNPTENEINLSNYSMNIFGNDFQSSMLSGNIEGFSTRVFAVGEENYAIESTFLGLSGFEENMTIQLLNNGELIDEFTSNSLPSFSAKRIPELVISTITFNDSEWIFEEAILSTPNVHHINFPVKISILYYPENQYIQVCDPAEFQVSINPESGVTWFYHQYSFTASFLAAGTSTLFSGANTTELVIPQPFNNSISLHNYQFYPRIIQAGCTLYLPSRYLNIEPQTKRIFRSKPSFRNWSLPSDWEFSEDNITWETSCIYPTFNFSDSILIPSGSNLSANLNTVAVRKVIVEENGILRSTATGRLSFFNSFDGPDFIVNGTFIDNSTLNNQYIFNTGTTWQLGPQGTFYKTNQASTLGYRDNYHNGMHTIPSTANWILQKTAFTNPAMQTDNFYYPNLIFEAVGLTWTELPSNASLSGLGPLIIKGNLRLGSGNGFGVSRLNMMTNVIQVEGDLVLSSGSSLSNNTASPQGRGIEVKGNVILNGNIDFQYGSNIGSGRFIFSGSSSQTVSGSGGLRVNFLEIANTADSVIFNNGDFINTFDNDIQVNSQLILNQGIGYIPNDSKWLYLNTTATHTGAGSARYIDGKVRKVGSTAFQFPVGGSTADGDGYYQPISISGLSGIGTFEARYYAETHPNAVPYYDGFNFEVGTCDYWSLTKPTIASGGPTAVVTLTYGNNPCNSIGEPEYLSIARWNGLDWENPIDAGVDPLVPFEVSSATAVAANGFGDFALATTQLSENNVLPVSWLFFEARKIEQTAHLVWATATELNNDYYTVYRATANGDFQEIGRLPGAGTSAHSNTYEFTDNHPQPGTNYYRIRQTDFNGDFSETDVRSLTFGEGDLALLQSRASFDGLSLLVAAPRGGTLTLTDLNGRILHSRPLSAGQSEVTLTDQLARGVYLVRLSDDRSEVVHRVVR